MTLAALVMYLHRVVGFLRSGHLQVCLVWNSVNRKLQPSSTDAGDSVPIALRKFRHFQLKHTVENVENFNLRGGEGGRG